MNAAFSSRVLSISYLYRCLRNCIGLTFLYFFHIHGERWVSMGPGWLEDLVLEEEPNSGKPSTKQGVYLLLRSLPLGPNMTLETGTIQISQRSIGQCE